MVFGQRSLSKDDYRRGQDRWVLSVGVNALANVGTKNPLERIDDFAFRQPFAAAIEYRWSPFVSVEQDFSFNGYESNTRIDNGILTEDVVYFSTNATFKWYFSSYFYDLEIDWLDVYAGTGLGVFVIDEFNTSVNLSLGALFWVNPQRTIGVRVHTMGKFAFNSSGKQYDNNHMQHFLQVVFRL